MCACMSAAPDDLNFRDLLIAYLRSLSHLHLNATRKGTQGEHKRQKRKGEKLGLAELCQRIIL